MHRHYPGFKLARAQHAQRRHHPGDDEDEDDDSDRAAHDGRDLGLAEDLLQLLEAGPLVALEAGELLAVHLRPGTKGVVQVANLKRWVVAVYNVTLVFFQEGQPRWPSGKASASRAEDPGFESSLRRDFFGVESYQ